MYKKEYRTVVYNNLRGTTESYGPASLEKMEEQGWEVVQYDKSEGGKLIYLFTRPALISMVESLSHSVDYNSGDIRRAVYGKYDAFTNTWEKNPKKCPYCQAEDEEKGGNWYHNSDCPWGLVRKIQKELREMLDKAG